MTAEQFPLSAAHRPLTLRARRDLRAQSVVFQGERYWHLKDPVTLSYYQLREEEHFAWSLLDGRRSLNEIRARCAERFAPRTLEPGHLYGFLALLHREGLAIADVPGQGQQLLSRGNRKQREQRNAWWRNPLAIRFRGLNPDPFLGWLAARMRWLFSPATGWFLLFAVIAAGLLVVLHWREALARLPDFRVFFSGQNLLWLAVALAGVKVAHELAHGLACKYFGAECTELGIMLLVGTPCLYCNVSDTWMLPGKWPRILVSSAGVLVELALAAVATLVWWFTEPGRLHLLSLNIIFVCSVGTLLLNGNPLLRYDGYYVLADWVEVPNLRSRAATLWRRLLSRAYLGFDPGDDRLSNERGAAGLLIYGALAGIYRTCVIGVIAWFFYRLFLRYHLPALASAVVVLVAIAAIAMPVAAAVRLARNPAERSRVKWRRFLTAGGISLSAICFIGLVPLPYAIRAPAVLRLADAAEVYVTAPGQLVSTAVAGQPVRPGEPLAELRNPEIEREVSQLAGKLAVQDRQVANLKRQQGGHVKAAQDLPAAEETLEALAAQLAERRRYEQQLVIAAPTAGVVFPPAERHNPDRHDALPVWSGSPLEPPNRGCFLESGTLLCRIGDPRKLEALVIVDATTIAFLKVGQSVHLRLDGSPVVKLSGQVRAISVVEVPEAPPELIAAGTLPATRTPSGSLAPLETTYQAVISLDLDSTPLLPGLVGQARISAGYQTLFQRLRRAIAGTMRFAR